MSVNSSVYRRFLTLIFALLGTAIFAQNNPNNIPQPESSASVETTAVSDDADAAPAARDVPDNGSLIEGEPSFRLSENDSGMLFFQRLTWDEGEYAVYYTVVLERKRESLDFYTEVLRRNVKVPDTFLDISVPPGEYRYRVMSFNILGQLDIETNWEHFTVLPALYPSIFTFSPSAFYFDRYSSRIILLTGENLIMEAEIYLVSQTMTDESGQPLILRPREILRNQLGENARLIFDEGDLVAGKYTIVVKNPGGLETETGDFTIALAKPYDINVAGGYTPMLTVFGRTDYFLDHVFIPLGFSARASFVPFKWNFGNLGFELTPSWSILTSEQDDYKTRANLVLVNVGAVFQYWIIRNELSVNGRAGLGLAGIFNYHFEFEDTGKKWDPINTMAFSLSFGSSIQWFFYKQIFFEGGLDLVFVTHPEIPMGLIRIGLFGGYQF